MEGGGILQCCNSIYSGDHLATSNSVTETRVPKTRRWLTAGFNGFGQLGMSEGKRKLPQFQEFKTPFAGKKLPLVFDCCWSYLAVACECSLHLQGFIFNEPSTVTTIKTVIAIKSIALCDRYCLILQEDGRLYKILTQVCTAMEEVKFQAYKVHLPPQKRSVFGERKSMHNFELGIDFVACGNNIMVAIGNSNEVFGGTTQIHKLPNHVRTKQLVCGFEHALLLTTNGDMYSWGNGLRGQLGQEILRLEERPICVEALAGIKIFPLNMTFFDKEKERSTDIDGDEYESNKTPIKKTHTHKIEEANTNLMILGFRMIILNFGLLKLRTKQTACFV